MNEKADVETDRLIAETIADLLGTPPSLDRVPVAMATAVEMIGLCQLLLRERSTFFEKERLIIAMQHLLLATDTIMRVARDVKDRA